MQFRTCWLSAALLTASLCALYSAPVGAQSNTTGVVVGVVTDPSGAAIPGAAITLTDRGTGQTQSVQTNLEGRYVFPNVRLGTFAVAAAKTGFQTAQVNDQTVSVGAATTVNFRLTLGASTQTVEVTATAGAELQTMNATMGTTLNSAAMLTLPNLGRDSSALMVYQPATAAGGQVAGGIADQNTFMLDGGNNTDDLDGTNTAYNSPFASSGAGVMPTPVESLQELKVATSNQTADYGASSGGEIMMVTKRGTQQWHGSLYDFFQANWLNANTWSNNRFNTPLQKFHKNRFGGAVGGPIAPLGDFLGGKTFFYVNFEGQRYPQSGTTEVTVPSATLRQGILTFNNAAGTPIPYNLQTATDCGPAGTAACDPRGVGIAPLVATDWSKYTPVGNDPSAGDTLNTVGYRGQLFFPIKDDFIVGRLDHDFGKNWRGMVSYRWFDEVAPSSAQIDFGGVLPGDRLGQFQATANRPIQPDYWVASLTGQITSNLTNDLHFNYVRNWWQWQTAGVPFQLASQGVNAGVTVDAGTGSGLGLDGMDIGWGDARQRVWNGHDFNWRDDVSWLHGNHFVQFGTTLTHDWLHHARDDDGNSALESLRYLVGTAGGGSGVAVSSAFRPPTCNSSSTATSACIPASQAANWDALYYAVLGVVGQANQVITRSGSNLAANPLGTPAFDYVTLNDDSLYVSDSWHLRPSLTFTYGINWGYSSPPTEQDGKQTLLVDQAGQEVLAADFFATKERMALLGQNYNPTLGFAPIGSVGDGTRRMFNHWWGGFAPRLALAWNPTVGGTGWMAHLLGNNQTVLRGGWSRLIDRTN
ncbi:MAG: carboxypeptidase regulatory-like domain-containing protein, partial [Terriglobales bacterium]